MKRLPPDYVTLGVDPRCDCKGDRRECKFRCQVCRSCGYRIKGIWWIEHTNLDVDDLARASAGCRTTK